MIHILIMNMCKIPSMLTKNLWELRVLQDKIFKLNKPHPVHEDVLVGKESNLMMSPWHCSVWRMYSELLLETFFFNVDPSEKGPEMEIVT